MVVLDDKINLVAFDVNLLIKGVTHPYQIIKYDQNSDKLLVSDEQNILLVYTSGMIQMIQNNCLFRGKIPLEGSKGQKDYLVWKQKGNLFAAADRYNVVTFWNCLTGRVIYKKVLEGKARIEKAHCYRNYSTQARFEDLTNQFDAIAQPMLSCKKNGNVYGLKMVKLNLFEKSHFTFDASCHTLLSDGKVDEINVSRGVGKVSDLIQSQQ